MFYKKLLSMVCLINFITIQAFPKIQHVFLSTKGQLNPLYYKADSSFQGVIFIPMKYNSKVISPDLRINMNGNMRYEVNLGCVTSKRINNNKGVRIASWFNIRSVRKYRAIDPDVFTQYTRDASSIQEDQIKRGGAHLYSLTVLGEYFYKGSIVHLEINGSFNRQAYFYKGQEQLMFPYEISGKGESKNNFYIATDYIKFSVTHTIFNDVFVKVGIKHCNGMNELFNKVALTQGIIKVQYALNNQWSIIGNYTLSYLGHRNWTATANVSIRYTVSLLDDYEASDKLEEWLYSEIDKEDIHIRQVTHDVSDNINATFMNASNHK